MNTQLKPSTFLLPVLLLGALLAIATVQYRWIAELGKAESDRLRQLTQRGAQNLIRELDAHIWSLFEHFATATPQTVDDAVQAWRLDSTYPQLLDSVVLIDEDQARRWDETGRSWQPTELDGSLSELQRRISRLQRFRWNRRGSPRRSGQPTPDAGGPGPGLGTPDFPILLAEVPALVRMTRGADSRDANGPPATVLALVIDRAYLEGDFLSSLVELHLDLLDTPELTVLVRELREQGQVVWPQDVAPPVKPPTWQGQLFRIGPRRPTRSLDESRDARDSATDLDIRRRPRRGRGPGSLGPPPAAWSIELRLDDGAFRATLDSHRRRNLLLSGGVLLVLAASVALLLRANHRATSLARRRLELIAGVTHELNTPIAAMSAAADNLADGVVQDPKKVAQYGALIRAEGDRLRRLVAQTLELSSLESGAQAFVLASVDLEELADAAVVAAHHSAPELEVELDVPEDLPAIAADRDAIERVVVNLLVNAAKYAGGKAILSAKREGQRIRIAVSDQGPGIPRGERAEITEPFRRGSHASTQAKGSGLGLHLVQRLLKRHASELELESRTSEEAKAASDVGATPETGSTFSFAIGIWSPTQPPHDGARPTP